MSENKRELVLDSKFAVIDLPINTIEAKITLKVYENGEMVTVERVLDLQEVLLAFKKADDGYIDEEDKFVVTDLGKQYLKEKYGDDGL